MFLALSLTLILVGLFLLLVLYRQRRYFGVLTAEKIYQDSENTPGEILYAKSLPLSGKPDYIITQGEYVIPVEVKTGKTPSYPYLNHTMQLMAYCILVMDTYGKRPPGGIIKYPDKEFKIAFTKEAEESLVELLEEIHVAKKSQQEFLCTHPQHNA